MCSTSARDAADRVEEEIRIAFADVPPPDDDDLTYPGGDDGADLFAFHNPSWGSDWSRVPAEVITANYASLGFMGARAFPFYLPAYMLYVLHDHPIGSLVPDRVVDCLHKPALKGRKEAPLRSIALHQISALTLPQKRAILSFLKLARETMLEKELREMAEDAMVRYWAQFNAGRPA